jgi:hypothetical protein
MPVISVNYTELHHFQGHDPAVRLPCYFLRANSAGAAASRNVAPTSAITAGEAYPFLMFAVCCTQATLHSISASP